MSRWIDADAIDYRNDKLIDKSVEFLNGVIYMATRIGEAPSIDIEPKRGEWIAIDDDDWLYDSYRCSACGKELTVDSKRRDDIGFTIEDLNFCPNCGADMREREGER